MPMTPANDNILAQTPNNGVAQIPPNINSSPLPNQSANISTIKRDSSQQQLQQLQQYTQQQNQPVPNLQQSSLAKAQLVCRPNSHPFPVSSFQLLDVSASSHLNLHLQSRTLLLEPNKPVKIGRAIARTKVSENNAIFDCKVLSRNHAELWYDDGKFYLKVSDDDS